MADAEAADNSSELQSKDGEASSCEHSCASEQRFPTQASCPSLRQDGRQSAEAGMDEKSEGVQCGDKELPRTVTVAGAEDKTSATTQPMTRIAKSLKAEKEETKVENKEAPEAIQAREEYEEIKARTMFRMIEDIDDQQRLLFLTNHQAELIAQPDNIAKLVDAMEIEHLPKLLMVLQWSGNFQSMMASQGLDSTDYTSYERENSAFLRKEEAQVAQTRLDRFMLEVCLHFSAARY